MNLFKLPFFVFLILLLVACGSSTKPSSEVAGFEKTSSGLYYKIHSKGANFDPEVNPPLEIGDYIFGYYEQYWGDEHYASGEFLKEIETPLFAGDITEGFLMMNIGDSATFAINADSVVKYWGVSQPTELFLVDYFKMSVRIDGMISGYEIRKEEAEWQAQRDSVIEVRTAEELSELQAYIRKNRITATPNSEGVYVIVQHKGDGPQIATGQTVAFNFVGRRLDGSIWDSNNEDICFDAGLHFPQRIYRPQEIKIGEKAWMPGLDKALTGQTIGSKLRIILPSEMAFGQDGSAFAGAFQPLMIDVDLLGVK